MHYMYLVGFLSSIDEVPPGVRPRQKHARPEKPPKKATPKPEEPPSMPLPKKEYKVVLVCCVVL